MTSIETFLLLVGALFFPFGIAWLLHCIIEHQKDKLYSNFYKEYGETRTGEILEFSAHTGRGEHTTVLVVRFYDESGHGYTTAIHTNDFKGRQYRNKTVAEFLCIFEAIKAQNPLQFFKSVDPKRSVDLYNIPLAVIPGDEDFVHVGRIERLSVPLIVLSFLSGLWLVLVIGEHLSTENLNLLSKFGYRMLPLICILLLILIVIRVICFIRRKKRYDNKKGE